MSGIFEWRLCTLIVLSYICSAPMSAQLQYSIGQFHSFAHGLTSSWVTVLDDKTIHISNFFYDGLGPAAWFVLGKGQDCRLERVRLSDFTVIPDENYSCNRLNAYQGHTIQLTLPGALTIHDFDYLAVYCLEFSHNFGFIPLPKNLNVAAAPANNLEECRTPWSPTALAPQTNSYLTNYLLPYSNNYASVYSNVYSSVAQGK